MYSDSEQDLEDNVQEVAFQMWRSFESFEGKSKISTWMYRVALNVCMFQLKKRKRVKATKEQWINHVPEDDLKEKEQLEITMQILLISISSILGLYGLIEVYIYFLYGKKLERLKTLIQQIDEQ